MGETNSPSVAHVGYDNKFNLTFLSGEIS